MQDSVTVETVLVDALSGFGFGFIVSIFVVIVVGLIINWIINRNNKPTGGGSGTF